MSRHCFTALHSLTEGIGLQSGQEITESRFVAELQQQLVTSVESGVKSHKQGSIPSFNSNSVQVNLGNSGHLNQDLISPPTPYSGYAKTLTLSQNALKHSTQTHMPREAESNKRSKNVVPQYIT
ncbi:hypothetical protein DAPPUDRAFT_238722 [Daphnia pulex]|uniref:Uncharacterized protein n=1 Tax=Daphnia pulex TaxID=6669 RepID=E9G783_DAPPU|nr:hypothetical protein DAPPUDRAFT_238722 [Daphnia pulex]|eukprot:EFX84421.1 hypothetical protein DAPPUDRAFT_238722 [Daphnia pulex]